MNRNFNKSFAGLLFCIGSPLFSLAQHRDGTDTTFKTQSLDFYSTYKPEIAPAPKPVLIPALPIVDTSKPTLTYSVPEQNISYAYKAEPIKPLALKRERAQLPFANYAKVALGNNNTFLLDAGIGSLMGDNYDAVLHFNHLSQKGSQVAFQKWSQNTLDGSSNFYFPKYTLNVGLQADRRAYRQYGYSNFLYEHKEVDIKNVYSGVMVNASLAPVGPTFWDLQYKPSVRLYWWHSGMGATERNMDFSIPVSKTFDSSLTVSLTANAGITGYQVSGANSIANNYFQLNPAVDFNYSGFKARLGLKPTWASQNNYVLPDVYVSGNLLENSLKLYAGWQGSLLQNTFRSLSLFNPFMQANYAPVQGRLSHVYGGFETSLSNHLTIGGTVGYKMWRNLAMYQNDYLSSVDGRQFGIVYEDMNAIVINAKAQYQINEQFGLNGSATWNLYDAKRIGVRAQQLPQIDIKAGFHWRPIEKLSLNANMTLLDRMFVMKANGVYDKLPTIIDLSAAVNYDINKRIGVFVNVDNILNQRYQYWNQYQSLGFTISAGLRIKF